MSGETIIRHRITVFCGKPETHCSTHKDDRDKFSEKALKMYEKRICDLRHELTSLKENRDDANREARKWIEIRTAGLDHLKKFREEIKNLREKRDTLNEEVQKLKNLREQAKSKRNEKQKEISVLEEKMRPLIKNKPAGDITDIQKEIEEIDWKIQTALISSNEEKYLVDQVKTLETHLLIYRQLQKTGKRIAELKAEKRSLSEEARLHHEKLSELAKQSQKLHEEMINMTKEIHNIQNEANNAHKKYLEAKQHSHLIHQKYVESLSQIKSLEQGIRRTEEEKKAEIELGMREKLKQKSLEKLKRGEKLAWAEFQILTEEGLV